MIESPKDRFLKDEVAVRNHNDLVERESVRSSIEVALAELVYQQSDGNPVEAGRLHDRVQGAKALVRTWLQLAKRSAPIERTRPASLIYGDAQKPATS